MLMTKTNISIAKTSQPNTSDTTSLIKLSCQVLEARYVFVNRVWGEKGEAGVVRGAPAQFLQHSSTGVVNPAGGRINKRGLAVAAGVQMEEESEDSNKGLSLVYLRADSGSRRQLARPTADAALREKKQNNDQTSASDGGKA